jgi:hypothetical protein
MYVIEVFVGFGMFFLSMEREAASFVESLIIQKFHFFGNLIQGYSVNPNLLSYTKSFNSDIKTHLSVSEIHLPWQSL